MIKIENVSTYGWETAIKGMRNPLNSWDKSDSYYTHITDCEVPVTINSQFHIGENDLKLMQSLIESGSDHSKFMRMITVTVDITAPLYWWKEFDTYKVGTVRNSCSTMHKIHSKEFTLADFSHEQLSDYHSGQHHQSGISTLEMIIKELNYYRDRYLAGNKKVHWWQMIQLLPSSYNQRATVQLNYAVLKNMYHARKNHKLDEWREFCAWIESLPYAQELIVGGAK